MVSARNWLQIEKKIIGTQQKVSNMQNKKILYSQI